MKTRIIVLAAGKGTRMNPVRNKMPEASADAQAHRISNGVNGEMPKALILFGGKPMIRRLLDAVAESGVDPRPVVITGFQAPLVEQTLGPSYDYVRQNEQFGTGHAVLCAEKLLSGAADQIIVLYGDHPFVRPERIRELQALQEKNQCPVALLTVIVDDFTEWRAPFADFSRIVRDGTGRIIADVQVKDATPAEMQIHEVNPAFFAFNAAWLWPHLKKITNDNAAGEYYLTDLTKMAIAEGECIASLPIDPREAIGINTPEHLEAASRLVQ